MPLFIFHFSDGSMTETFALHRQSAFVMYPNAVRITWKGGEHSNAPELSAGPPESPAPSKGTPVIVAPTRTAFRLNMAAVRAAVAELGLTTPVRIRFNGRKPRYQGVNGNYCHRLGYHDIMIKTYLDAAEASSTLWHELTHAMQAERVGGQIKWGAHSRAQRSYKYENRPIEIEARAMSAAKVDQPLTF